MDVAQIASQLVPRMQKHFSKGADHPRLRIVGYSSPNLTAPGYEWRSILERWVNELHCSISYLLVNPSEEAIAYLKQTSEKHKTGQGKLEVFWPERGREYSDEMKLLLKQWETFHFVHCENENQLWVESFHPKDDTRAFGCLYYSPQAVKSTRLHNLYRERFDFALSKNELTSLTW